MHIIARQATIPMLDQSLPIALILRDYEVFFNVKGWTPDIPGSAMSHTTNVAAGLLTQ